MLNFLFAVLLMPIQTLAETRQEIRDIEDRSQFNYNTKSNDRAQKQEREFGEKLASKDLGFSEKQKGTMESDPVAQTIVSAFTKSPTFESLLIFRLQCIIENSPLPLNLKYKDIKWSLAGSKGQKTLSGSIQSDAQGIAKIVMSTEGRAQGKTLKVDVDGITKEIVLGSGPYEIFLPEKSCKPSK
ncbi:hypothetical protein ACLVWU_08725 [Bdellovibrio sp. HCB290]|uniref:hypothetical protein n=1 Tax=Bdellovibrio sp. HCB290 TaxID=3394356 RepID=UPI0039B513EF